MNTFTLEEWAKLPTLFEDKERGMCHESLFKSYQILECTKAMLKRGDSVQTILEVIELLEQIKQKP